ncbi:MAG: hypothetical protein MUO53_10020 [Maribacter sp.]|nr:hypothetical protein [Maribacter sp.]
MEIRHLFKSLFYFAILAALLALASCGPVVITSRVDNPPPPWFYPNRLEIVRYVYFPEYNFYYDLSARTYLYLDAGMWVRHSVLPPQYRNINLNRSRYERIRNYGDENISRYHEEHNANRGRSNQTTRTVRRNN